MEPLNPFQNFCIYLVSYSDRPGQHDFNVLKKLVLPDGSILRAQLPGKPSRDSLFVDPARDGKRYAKRVLSQPDGLLVPIVYFHHIFLYTAS